MKRYLFYSKHTNIFLWHLSSNFLLHDMSNTPFSWILIVHTKLCLLLDLSLFIHLEYCTNCVIPKTAIIKIWTKISKLCLLSDLSLFIHLEYCTNCVIPKTAIIKNWTKISIFGIHAKCTLAYDDRCFFYFFL